MLLGDKSPVLLHLNKDNSKLEFCIGYPWTRRKSDYDTTSVVK